MILLKFYLNQNEVQVFKCELQNAMNFYKKYRNAIYFKTLTSIINSTQIATENMTVEWHEKEENSSHQQVSHS